jgi:hypothetical protein
LGDVNNDGDVDSNDITLISQLINKVYTEEEIDEMYSGAVSRANVDNSEDDGSGVVDSNDLTLISQYVNKAISSFE